MKQKVTFVLSLLFGLFFINAGLNKFFNYMLIIFPKTRALGALIIFPVMVGIVLTNTVTDASGFPIAAVCALILLWIMYDNRAKYMPLINE